MLAAAIGSESRGNVAGDNLVAVPFHDTNVSVWELSPQLLQVLNAPGLRLNERVAVKGCGRSSAMRGEPSIRTS